MLLKKLLPFIGVLLFNTAGGQWAQNFTAPTGVTNITVSGGSETEESYTFISTAYNQEPVYSGLVDDITGAILTLEDFTGTDLEEPVFEDNELTLTPHLLRLVDGNADGNADVSSTVNGMVFLVVGHVGNEIFINATEAEVATYFALYDGIEIIKANTLESLFGIGEDFVGLSGKPSSGDNILIWNSVGWKIYFYYNNKWQTFGTRSDQKGTIIYPDEGMVYVRRGDQLVLSFSGYAPLSVHSYLPPAGYKFLTSNPFPLAMSLSQLIDTSANWSSDPAVNDADQILVWENSAWSVYYHDANNWRNSMTGEIEDKLIEAGSSFMVLRCDDAWLVERYNKIDLPQ